MHKIFCLLILLISTCQNSIAQNWKQLNDSAKYYNDKRNYSEAIKFYSLSVKELQRDSAKTDTYINTLSSLSLAYVFYGDFKNAKEYFTETKNIIASVKGIENKQYAGICNALSNVYTNLGMYEDAEALFIETKSLREKLFGKETAEYAQVCNNLADLYRTTGSLQKAEALAIEARAIRKRVLKKNHPQNAISSINLANIYRDMGQYPKAEELYLEAKQIREDTLTKDHPDYASSCDILASLYYYMRQFDKAEQLYLEAKDLRNKNDQSRIFYASSCNNLALLYTEMKMHEKAERLALEANKIWTENLSQDHPSIQMNNTTLGGLYFAKGDYKNAEKYFTIVKNAWETSLGKEHQYYSGNLNELAKVYWNLGENQKAFNLFTQSIASQYRQIDNVFKFTNESEKELYLKNINGSADVFYSFNYDKLSPSVLGYVYTVSINYRNLILSSSQQLRNSIYNHSDREVRNKYEQWTGIKKKLAFLYSKEDVKYRNEIKSLEESANNLEKELTKISSAFKKLQTQISWQTIKKSLQPNEAAIEFVEFDFYNGKRWTDSTFYIALLIKANEPQPKLIKLFEKRELEDILSIAKTKEDINSTYTFSNEENNLYNKVWRPLEEHLNGIKIIKYAPSGLLHNISFASIAIDNSSVLSDKYKLLQLGTTASIKDDKNLFITNKDKILLFGSIEYSADSATLKKVTNSFNTDFSFTRSVQEFGRGQTWGHLPGTDVEIKSIEKLGKDYSYDVKSISKVDATEEKIKSFDGKASPSILHVATHGFFFPDPKEDKSKNLFKSFETSGKVFKTATNPLLRSGLLFAGANNTWQNKPLNGVEDGILTSYEVSNMYLPNTKLVVLSACETALGDIKGSEGVYGLQRAFKMAGVENLIMSLWKIPDNETAEFMQAFYKNLFKKQTIENAFYNAQKIMKNKYRNEPYKWGAWVLVR